MAAAATATTSTAAAEEEPSKWPWLYKPAEWDPPEVKKAYQDLLKQVGGEQDEFTGLDSQDDFGAWVDKFLYTRSSLPLREFPADPPAGKANIKISYKSQELSLLLPKFVSKHAPKRVAPEEDAGKSIEKIFGEDIRYACIAPGYTQPGYTVVMLSIWIKPRPGYKSKDEDAEKTMNIRYNVVSFVHNEFWPLSNLFFAMKDPKEALMFVNAVSKLVYTCVIHVDKEIEKFKKPDGEKKEIVIKHAYFRKRFENIDIVIRENKDFYKLKPELRVNHIRPALIGYLEITKCTAEERDKIDQERLDAESSDDEQAGATKARLETDAQVRGSTDGTGSGKTPTELKLKPEVLFVILDDEQMGLYENPLCEHAYYDLRLYQNHAPVAIGIIYVCQKTGQIEVQLDDFVYIVKAAESDPETFKTFDRMVREKKIVAKPKKIFSDPEQYLEYYEAMDMKLADPVQLKEFQDKMLEKLKEQNKNIDEAKAASKSKLPPGFPTAGSSGAKERPPSPPPAAKNWIRLVLNGAHQKEMPHPKLSEAWVEQVYPALTGLLASESTIEPANLSYVDSSKGDDDDLRCVINDIRDNLREHKCKQAIAKLKRARELFGGDLLSAINDMSDLDVLDRIFFLPG